MSEEKKGLYKKYFVKRTDGSSEKGCKHDNCHYFVIDITHDKYAKYALNAYADACEAEYPNLANDLRNDVKDKS